MASASIAAQLSWHLLRCDSSFRGRIPWPGMLASFGRSCFLSNAWSSQMGRFLLPVCVLSLALVLSAASTIAQRGWRAASAACVVTILAFLAFAGMSDAVCARDFLPVVLGFESQEAFLERTAPDYGTVEFMNRTLSPGTSAASGGNLMVFFRHFYYVRGPFVDGTPEYSWLMDRARYNDSDKLLAHLHEMNACWIVKSPNYPKPLAPAFLTLEQQGELVPLAST
jgi:hypothetical protein